MSHDPPQPEESAPLRRRAEKRLKSQTSKEDGSGAHTERLFHELQVHQIELELQNEELRESRAQLEAALERYTDLYDFAPVGYFTFSADGAIREVNLPGARLLGLERSRLAGKRFGAFVAEDHRPVFDSWLKEVFATRVKQTCAVSLAGEGRPPLVVEIEAALSLDGREGRAVVADITPRKALEEQLRQAQKMEVVGQLAGGVAHDFNNILASMLLSLEILQLQYPAEAQSSLGNLETLAKRAASLTRQLLLFSRRQAMHPEPVEINAALSHLLKMVERLLGENITYAWTANPRELWIEADAAMLDQAVMNLCLNARDAMPNGGTLTLEASLAEFDGGSVQAQAAARPERFACLRISDTGCGMDAEVLKHLFEPFFTTKEVGKGTGLGLASVYGIVQQHQGWVKVESSVGQGTSFRLYFPLSEKVEAAQARTRKMPAVQGQKETVLLVEDEAQLLDMMARALTIFGYRILPAAHSREALELWKQNHGVIDLVITDMRMPKGMNGLELAAELRKIKPSLPVIIMSGYSTEIVRNGAAGKDAYAFLAKPFDLKTLAETIRHCLD